MSSAELSPDVFAQLYAGPPDEFLSRRTALAAQLKDVGDAAAAKAVAALRKPTVAAAVVNRQAHADPNGVERLLELGDRLRVAHDDLDAAALRELSVERRALVAELSAAAFALVGTANPSAALRDEVTNTFDAAVADPQIAARLGRLTRPERWSGFGVAAVDGMGPPELTLVRGGKAGSRGPASSRGKAGSRGTASSRGTSAGPAAPERGSKPAAKPVPAAARRRLTRALDKARTAFDQAESDLQNAQQAEEAASDRVHRLAAELARVQEEHDDAKQELERSRRAAKVGRTKRREARTALDRAERHVERGSTD